MTLKLNGSPVNWDTLLRPIPPQLQKTIAFLDKHKDEVFDSATLAERAGMKRSYLQDHGTDPAIKNYTCEIGYHDRYFGHPQALAEFKREIARRRNENK